MTNRRILVIQGHPDPAAGHFCHALADAYAEGARTAGHDIRAISVTSLRLPWLSSQAEWEAAEVPEPVRRCQQDIAWAEHLFIIYPLWLGGMPAMLKGFLEQVARPGFAVGRKGEAWPGALLSGRSSRIVVTMGMPALVYRWYFGAHNLKSLKRNILRFCGIKPNRATIIGTIESLSDRRRSAWLATMRELGRKTR